MKQPSLFDVPDAPDLPPDQAAREFAVEPGNDVVLEASAGTGKTRVLVDRYVRLIERGVDPRNILAITFTRKAAAEMRERVLASLRRHAAEGRFNAERWRELRHRISDINVSTIDAFCFSLLREFPLEAGVEPGFDVADETEMGRFGREAVERALAAARVLLPGDENLRLLFTRVKAPVLARAIEELLDRRQVALPAVASFVRRQMDAPNAAAAADAWLSRLRTVLAGSRYRTGLLESGPQGVPEFDWLRADLSGLDDLSAGDGMARIRQLRHRIERYFLTKGGDPRKRLPQQAKPQMFASRDARQAHEAAVVGLAPAMTESLASLEDSINALLARGLLRLLTIACEKYDGLLEAHALLDFAGMLDRSVALLSRQEEFARSRLKLQSRYHHVLVDEFQDTSRQQWRLVELLVDAWGEGEGAADAPTSIFVVGDRKQSIYRFRHAEVTLLDEAAGKIAALRPHRPVRQAITASFRAVPELLAFVNALSEAIVSERTLPERFTYTDRDRFPAPGIGPGARRDGRPVLGLVAEPTMALCASAVAAEVERLLKSASVRDRQGPPRSARPDDIAILFRARAGHQLFEQALERRGIRTYVYKGLGFFDAPEVQDLQALVRWLAQPESDLRAAEFLRSRFVRISDIGLTRLAPAFSAALLAGDSGISGAIDDLDRAILEQTRRHAARWLGLADRLRPSELVDLVLRDSAYAWEMRGRRLDQARENVKKVRGLMRRVESRGYATLHRIAEYFATLRAGEESNAILEASGAVNLMTMHAAKGLEFPIVFLVNLQMPGRGRGGGFTVVERGPGGEPAVAFGSNEATALEDERDNEELRRLLYVGVTRARDRLYLAGQVDGRLQLRRSARSLAHLLPASIGALFHDAAIDPGRDRVTWTTAAATFEFAVCRAAESDVSRGEPEADLAAVDIARLAPAQPAPVSAVVDALAADSASRPVRGARSKKRAVPSPHDRLIGTLVHRMFERQPDVSGSTAELSRRFSSLIAAEERVDLDDPAAVVGQAIDVYRRFRDRADVQALLESGRCLYEVPYSHAAGSGDGGIVRGVIDCLVVPETGDPTVVEFKTGEPRPGHEDQAERYRAAVGAILGKNRVKVKILYA